MQSLADDLAGDLGDRLRLGDAGRRASSMRRTAFGSSRRDGVDRSARGAGRRAAGDGVEARLLARRCRPRLARALGVWESGAVIKVLVRYPRAFWRERGLSGMVMWRDLPGLFACDASKDAEHAALVVFIGGPLALRWRGAGRGGAARAR